ncbi:hypothetical protein GZH47_09875 [Paenibacillus rhizovicinus]|uniref:Uncharacterized protein n=1 Tax=Paenibacillus rhizovicinus TaxID=2704463 RepID=A0A6C0P396_9BACL|nr:hypothetical protein [Paenibacillus rhizovicinus]QHW31132.1 hypothetical protein GZH47_09875 [Paenibacillus rhizovicinus]
MRYVKDLKVRHFGIEHVFGQTAAMIAKTVRREEKNHTTNFRLFSGAKTVTDFQICLKGYDTIEYPEGSGWSYARYYYPEASD